MLQENYDFSPARTDFELRVVGGKKPTNPFPLISIAQRLSEAEKFILSLENMLTQSINRERQLNVDLVAIKTMNLALRVDALNYEIAITALQDREPPQPITQVASDRPVVSTAPQEQPREKRIEIFGFLTGRR